MTRCVCSKETLFRRSTRTGTGTLWDLRAAIPIGIEAVLLLSFTACLSVCSAQAPRPSNNQISKDSTSRSLEVKTRTVLLDVVVRDRMGRPVHGIPSSSFQVFDEGKLQRIRYFDEHKAYTGELPAVNSALSSNTFTNFVPPRTTQPINVLLLDELNTPRDDMSYLRGQLIDYLKKAPPGRRIAIFGLNHRLSLIVGFDSDPKTLLYAVEHHGLIPSPLPSNVGVQATEDSTGLGSGQSGTSNAPLPSIDPATAASIQGGIQDLLAEQSAAETVIRAKLTLDALDDIARYLSGFNGKKSLLWFSGSFPQMITPGLNGGTLAGFASLQTEVQKTTALLARNQIAVYPIDPRGLETSPIFKAASDSKAMGKGGLPAAASDNDYFAERNNEHGTMDTIATATGGQAFYNTNDLASAVEQAMNVGLDYYTVAFDPPEASIKGAFHSLIVKLSDVDYQLSYRHGYYDQLRTKPVVQAATQSAPGIVSHSEVFDRAMHLHAPNSREVVLEVHVQEASTNSQHDNGVSPNTGSIIQIAVDPHGLSFIPQQDGSYSDRLAFVTVLYGETGKILNVTEKSLGVNLTAAGYAAVQKSGLRYDQAVDLTKHKTVYIRVGVREIDTDHVGTVEFSINSLHGLN